MVFDEFNGSHGEQVDLSDAGDEDPSQDILTMGVGALLPMEHVPCEGANEDTSTTHAQTTTTPTSQQEPVPQEEFISQEQELGPTRDLHHH